MLGKIIFAILAAAAAIFLTLLSAAFAQAYRAREFGNEFLSDARNLRVGQSTYEDVLRIRAKYRSRSLNDLGSCDQNSCETGFSGGNKWLYHLGLVPGAVFIGGLTVRQGVLVKISATYACNPGYDANTEETVGGSPVSAYEVRHKQAVSALVYKSIWVHITSAATPAQRERAYAYNLSCLTKLGGCKDANEILPLLRKLTEANRPPPPPPD